ncbi:MAG: hypothetical protein IJI47_07330, partial [Eubacterium sp.]|nr:hypothetical protein [Eubacterium sp.]
MKFSKKILAAVLAALMAISMMPFTAFATEWTDQDVWGPDLQTGDILSSDVEEVHGLEEYTLTLQAGGYGDDFDVADSDLVTTSWQFDWTEAPWGGNTLRIFDYSNDYQVYYPYNANGTTNQWYVIDVDHDNQTITLSGSDASATPAADEVSETISLAYGPSGAISGTHYSVSADNLVGESSLIINDMHPMTINARKGETITKVVLTYRTGDDKDTLSASAGTFDGDATFSNINAQQVTISSWENVDITGVTVYFEGDLDNPTVTLTGGANTKSSGGLSTQSYLPGAMDTVTYTALADATFPEFETYTQNGVTVERTSNTVVTVSGTPTANTAITVPDAESSSKIVTWNATLINDYIADEISDGNGYSDTANGITLTTSEGAVDYFGNSYLETYDGTTLSFSTTAGKFTSIEIEANNIYDGGNWTKDENILKWNGTPSESVSLTGDVFIMGLSSITFVIKPNTYTVTWQNEDGTELETDTDVAEGTVPTYDGATPTKATDEKYMYFFSGWSPEVTAVTGDITYTAQFDKQVVGLYLLKGDVVDKDETIRFPLVTRGNEFSGHVLKVYLDGELVKSVEVQGASSIEPDRYYTTTQKCIVSQFSKGSTWPTVYNTIYLTSLHTVTWQNEDGTVLETDTDVEAGTTPTYNGETPTKAATVQYTYAFTGWTPEVSAVTGDVIYTAVYSQSVRQYTVTWKNYDDSVIGTSTVNAGQTPEFSDSIGQIKAKPADGNHSYEFTGWTPEIVAAEADAEYTATFVDVLSISNVDEWNSFAASVKGGNTYSGKIVRMTADVGPVTTMVAGTFSGTFDGGSHTLTVNISGGNASVATFQVVKDATIQNLTLAGSITSSGIHSAALVKSVSDSGTSCTIKNVDIYADVNCAQDYIG